MAIFDTNLDYTKLIQFTDGTLQLASFVQIRNALVQRFKDIYGNDIDISPASADGQYINSIALLINNTFQSLRQAYDALDPAVATGQYLDTLCSYNNISRIDASSSTAELFIYNATAKPITVRELLFIDRNNLLWKWDNGGVDKTFEVGKYTTISDVECEKEGAISAEGAGTFWKWDSINQVWEETNDPEEATWTNDNLYLDQGKNGTIYQCVNNNGLRVFQEADALVGNERETDEALRSRRYQMLGNNSVTVLEGLKGNLLNISGVKDVHIFNNGKNVAVDLTDGSLSGPNLEPLADNTNVLAHSIYIAIRYKNGYDLERSPEVIGSVIYNKLTPGINTTPITFDESNPPEQVTTGGTQGEMEIVRTEDLVDKVYWKICSGENHPDIVINFLVNTKLYEFPENTPYTSHDPVSDTEKRIVENIKKYIDDVKIDEWLTVANLLTILQQSDLQKEGMSTFFAQSGTIDSTETTYPSNLDYFYYDTFKFEYTVNGNGVPTGPATLTITKSE